MCLPCITDIILEDDPQTKKRKEITYWDSRAGGWVKIVGNSKIPIVCVKTTTASDNTLHYNTKSQLLSEIFRSLNRKDAQLIMAAAIPQNFQPQTPDTTNGPTNHTYIPRADGSILIGGVAYIPQATATATVPVVTEVPATISVAAVPVAAAGVAVPSIYPPPQPVVYNQPYLTPPQPVYQPQYQPQYQMPYQQPYQIAAQPYVNGYPSFNIGYQQPGWGQTGAEVLGGQMHLAQESDINKKQEMKPADDDPFRMYWCRELDGTWTQRNRLTIDSGDIGDCRWYAMDGQFYAVRLSD